jgi:hypothetical protein
VTDHERGCQGREYTCTCGYDDNREALIETLTEALQAIASMHDGNPPLPLADMPEIDYARRTISTIHREARTAIAAAKEMQS